MGASHLLELLNSNVGIVFYIASTRLPLFLLPLDSYIGLTSQTLQVTLDLNLTDAGTGRTVVHHVHSVREYPTRQPLLVSYSV